MNYKRLFVPNSLIFITIVTKDRKQILTENIKYLRDAFKLAKQKFEFEIYAIIVNQDHIHMIIRPDEIKSYPKNHQKLIYKIGRDKIFKKCK